MRIDRSDDDWNRLLDGDDGRRWTDDLDAVTVVLLLAVAVGMLLLIAVQVGMWIGRQ